MLGRTSLCLEIARTTLACDVGSIPSIHSSPVVLKRSWEGSRWQSRWAMLSRISSIFTLIADAHPRKELIPIEQLSKVMLHSQIRHNFPPTSSGNSPTIEWGTGLFSLFSSLELLLLVTNLQMNADRWQPVCKGWSRHYWLWYGNISEIIKIRLSSFIERLRR